MNTLVLLSSFYSNEHEPVHVHAKKGEFESRAEFYIVDGQINEVKISNVKGRPPLKGSELRNLKIFLSQYGDKIIEKWIDYFVYHKDVTFEKITSQLK